MPMESTLSNLLVYLELLFLDNHDFSTVVPSFKNFPVTKLNHFEFTSCNIFRFSSLQAIEISLV
jgi:hypothetical protein